MKLPSLASTALVALLLVSTRIYGVSVGPQIGKPPPVVEKAKPQLPDRFDLVPMRMVVPILDPGFLDGDPKLEEKGIWPELRRAEAIRSAVKLRDAVIGINQFEEVLVTPDTSASADFYLLARIVESTGEILRIEYRVVDATGKVHLKRRDVNRVELGWHKRFGAPGVDAHQKLYDEIALNVWKVIKALDENHRKVKRRRSKNNMSDVEKLHAVRQLAQAQYFDPSSYQGTLQMKTVRNDEVWTIAYLPDQTSSQWRRVESIALRDSAFLEKMNSHYDTFRGEVDEPYELWQEEVFPIAREVRLAKRAQTIDTILVGAAAVATVAAAAEADSSQGVRDSLAVGGALTSAAIVKRMMSSARKREGQAQFDELTSSYHDQFKPMRVELDGQVVEFVGTAAEQYTQFQALMADIYQSETADVEAIQILD